MKMILLLLSFGLAVTQTACVQKAYRKTVVVMLTTPGKKDIQIVGIRGEGNPLSWREDLPMQAVVKDSLYTATVTAVTGYKFAEMKFTINGEFELEGQPNRTVRFTDKDTMVYNAIFNQNNQ
jgi:hypothetical protein